MSRMCRYACLSVLSLIAYAMRSEVSCAHLKAVTVFPLIIPGVLVAEFDLLPLINIIC